MSPKKQSKQWVVVFRKCWRNTTNTITTVYGPFNTGDAAEDFAQKAMKRRKNDSVVVREILSPDCHHMWKPAPYQTVDEMETYDVDVICAECSAQSTARFLGVEFDDVEEPT